MSDINIRIIVQSSTADSNINRTRENVQKLGTAGEQQSKKVTEGFTKINSVAQLALGAGAVAGVTMLTRKIIDLANHTEDLWRKQEQADMKVATLVKTTNMAAGFTAQQLYNQANEMQRLTTVGNESIEELQAKLLTFKSVRGDVFKQTIGLALDLGNVFGGYDQAILQLGKALEDPVTQLTYLRRSGISFSNEQQKQIKNLVAQNKLYDAQEMIVQVIKGQVGGIAEGLAQTGTGQLEQISNRFGDLGERIGEVVTDIKLSFVPELNGFLATANRIMDIVDRSARINQIVQPSTFEKTLHFLGLESDGYMKLAASAGHYLDALDSESKKTQDLITSSEHVIQQSRELIKNATGNQAAAYKKTINDQITLLKGRLNTVKASVSYDEIQAKKLDENSVAWRENQKNLESNKKQMEALESALENLTAGKKKGSILTLDTQLKNLKKEYNAILNQGGALTKSDQQKLDSYAAQIKAIQNLINARKILSEGKTSNIKVSTSDMDKFSAELDNKIKEQDAKIQRQQVSDRRKTNHELDKLDKERTENLLNELMMRKQGLLGLDSILENSGSIFVSFAKNLNSINNSSIQSFKDLESAIAQSAKAAIDAKIKEIAVTEALKVFMQVPWPLNIVLAGAAGLAAVAATNTLLNKIPGFASGGMVPVAVSNGEYAISPQRYLAHSGLVNALNSDRSFAKKLGGLISGPGSGTSDSIATVMPSGTFVVNAESTRYARPVLDAIEHHASGEYAISPQKYLAHSGLVNALNSDRYFAKKLGGLITGPGSGTSDSIATVMPSGTFVVNAESTRYARPVLDAIEHHSFGGIVSSSNYRSNRANDNHMVIMSGSGDIINELKDLKNTLKEYANRPAIALMDKHQILQEIQRENDYQEYVGRGSITNNKMS